MVIDCTNCIYKSPKDDKCLLFDEKLKHYLKDESKYYHPLTNMVNLFFAGSPTHYYNKFEKSRIISYAQFMEHTGINLVDAILKEYHKGRWLTDRQYRALLSNIVFCNKTYKTRIEIEKQNNFKFIISESELNENL